MNDLDRPYSPRYTLRKATPKTMNRYSTLRILPLLLVFCACGGPVNPGKAEYSVTAQENYQKGLAELEEEDWIAATKYFAFIKARFPYSKYAVVAELGMADAEFGAGNYLKAIESYRLFVKFHPTHEKVENGYAPFQAVKAYQKLLPTDFILLPPSFERDQATTSDAHRSLRQFIARYKTSEYQKEAAELMEELRVRLATHEYYVAQYYWERDRPMGTVMRLRTMLKKFPGTSLDGDALQLLARAYEKVNMKDRARETWERLAKEHPKHGGAKRARKALSKPQG